MAQPTFPLFTAGSMAAHPSYCSAQLGTTSSSCSSNRFCFSQPAGITRPPHVVCNTLAGLHQLLSPLVAAPPRVPHTSQPHIQGRLVCGCAEQSVQLYGIHMGAAGCFESNIVRELVCFLFTRTAACHICCCVPSSLHAMQVEHRTLPSQISS
jgi:hypothetical protein